MATIDKKLIHFNSETSFETAKSNNQLKDSSIVFVGDHESAKGKKIYTHGETYWTDYSGTNGISVQNGVVGNFSENLLYFNTTAEFEALITQLGGEDNLPVPCVIFVGEEGAVYYNS